MKAEIQLKIETIDDKSPYLQTVIILGDANKATLGFLPEGAFYKHASRRHIIVALEPPSGCIGYLLYRQSFDRITIVHLCVDKSHKGKGIARKLVDYLKTITQEYYGIGLTCRRDYEASNLWPKLGFVAQYEKAAKKRGKELVFWWWQNKPLPLFSINNEHKIDYKLCAVIDAGVFFTLSLDDECMGSQESSSLLADWLQSDLTLCITDEIFNKITNNIGNKIERNIKWEFAKSFCCLTSDNKNLDIGIQPIKNFFKKKVINIGEYDLRHIAKTIIATNVDIFITDNPDLLKLENEVYDNFKLTVIHPTDLIIQLDEIRRNPEYQPVRLAGTVLKYVRVHNWQKSILNEYCQYFTQGDTKDYLQQQLRQFISESHKFDCLIILEGENQPLALVVYNKHNKHELEIPLIRVRDNPLAATIANHLIFQATSLSYREKRQFTRITEPYLQETVKLAIQKDAFVTVKNGYLRANIAVTETALEVSERLINLANELGQEYEFCRHIANVLKTEGISQDILSILEIERRLFPAKIIDADIPNFIIPIKPFWAHNLFDENLASQTIFGATKTELALNREAVYYKSKKAPKELKPGVSGRILWYVSDDYNHGYREVSAIRACSRLDEVIIGKPKELYRCFRNLGIYEWQNVLNIAHKNLDNEIMALRFSDTELLKQPISLKTVQEILGNKITMQSSCYIKSENFAKIYALGT